MEQLKAIIAGLFFVSSFSTHAGVIINVEQSLGDVLFSGTGTIDLTGISPTTTGGGGSLIDPSGSQFGTGIGLYQNVTGDANSIVFPYLTNPGAFGPGGWSGGLPVSSVGDIFGVLSTFTNRVRLDDDYVSGAALSFQTTFIGQTFATLGLTPGTYQWTTLNDTITLNIPGQVQVPAPATLGLLSIGLVGVAANRRRRKS